MKCLVNWISLSIRVREINFPTLTESPTLKQFYRQIVQQQWVFPKLFREQEQGTTCQCFWAGVLWEQGTNGNREYADHSSVWSPRKAAGGFNYYQAKKNRDVTAHQRACLRDFHDIFSVFEFYEFFGFHLDKLIVETSRGFRLWWFPNEEPKRRRPPWKNNHNFLKKMDLSFREGPLLPGSSFETTKKERPPRGGIFLWGGGGSPIKVPRICQICIPGVTYFEKFVHVGGRGETGHGQNEILLKSQNSSIFILVLLAVLNCEYCPEFKQFVGLCSHMKHVFLFSSPCGNRHIKP